MLIVVYDVRSWLIAGFHHQLSKAEIQLELDITISESTIKRRATEPGSFSRVARKKPCVNKLNGTERLEYARTYREKPLTL